MEDTIFISVMAEHRYWNMDILRAEGIMVNVHYTPLYRNKFYQGMATDEEMKGSMQFFRGLLRLPIYPSLTKNERQMVVEAVKGVFSTLD